MMRACQESMSISPARSHPPLLTSVLGFQSIIGAAFVILMSYIRFIMFLSPFIEQDLRTVVFNLNHILVLVVTWNAFFKCLQSLVLSTLTAGNQTMPSSSSSLWRKRPYIGP